MSTNKTVNFERLLLELRPLLEKTAERNRFWEIRIHGSDGRARLELIVQGATYSYVDIEEKPRPPP